MDVSLNRVSFYGKIMVQGVLFLTKIWEQGIIIDKKIIGKGAACGNIIMDIDVGTGGHWGHVPPRFCNKQRSALFTLKNAPFFLRKSALEVSCPPSFRCFLRP